MDSGTLKPVLNAPPPFFLYLCGLEWGMEVSETSVGVICALEGSVLSIRRQFRQQ